MTDDEKSTQMFRAISMSNRVSVARIKLKRANRLSDSIIKDLKDIDRGIVSLTDCLIIGDDVRLNLDGIETHVNALEAGI